MKLTHRLLLFIGTILLVITSFVCRESLKLIVESDEREEHKIKNILHYIKEDSIKNKPIIDSLRYNVQSGGTDYNGMYLLGGCIFTFGIGITLLIVGYKRLKSAKKQKINSSHP